MSKPAEKKNMPGGGDAPQKDKKAKTVREEFLEAEEVQRTPSQIAREEAELRALMRKRRFKRRWPEVTKVKIATRPWHPPPPPRRPPAIEIERPPVTTRRWVPPYRRRRRRRPKLMRIPPEEVTKPLYECAKLRKIWHNFVQVERNKMMLQGTLACNTKKYSSTACGSQTGCIAVACCALLEETPLEQLRPSHVDELILAGDAYYHQCMLALKCYKGKPQLQLNQLLTSFYLGDTKYTVKMEELQRGLLAKHPDNLQPDPDLMTLMEKRSGSAFTLVVSVGGARHFLVRGEPAPPRSVCYVFDPHMLDASGRPSALSGAAAFLRYAGITSFVLDFLSNYGDLDAAKKGTPKPPITITSIEVVQRERLVREPDYGLDLKALKVHCRSEWESMHVNALIDKKRKEGMYPQGSLSAVSIATSRATAKKKVKEFYQKMPKEALPSAPVGPERAPPPPTTDQLMSLRGEDFFLYCPAADGHTYGRDDMIPRPKSETVVHSPVDIADQNFRSQYQQVDGDKWMLRATRHMASYRYQTLKWYSGIACCLSALGMLRRLRARAWCEDTLDETLDLGFNLLRESLLERGGPIRQLVLGEHKETFRIRDTEYMQKVRGVAVWGSLVSADPKVFDLCRGLETFFNESDSGILQVPGEYEVAIWHEGGKYYLYHPWPADRFGSKVGLRDGGKACLLYFPRISLLCQHFLQNAAEYRGKPFSISDISIIERKEIPEPVNQMKPVAPGRWVVRGRFHEGDARFPEQNRNKQATAVSIAAIAMAKLVPAATWTPEQINETLIRGDELYQRTMEHLERMGISLDSPRDTEEAGEEEESSPAGTLAAADVLNTFQITDYDSVYTEVMDSAYTGELNAAPSSGVTSLQQSLAAMLREHDAGVLTARGVSLAVFKQDDCLYMFDPHGCDQNGYPSEEPGAGACLVRVTGGAASLADTIAANLPAGADDSFNVSPVALTATTVHPNIQPQNKAYEWISKGTAAVLMGPRGENTAVGKIAEKAGIPMDAGDGRQFAPAAAAAFVAASASVPPLHMHRDHIYCLLDAGAEYYRQHVKRSGRAELRPEDLSQPLELGANTLTLQLADPLTLPLRLPDEPPGEGEEEEGGGDDEDVGEELEEEIKEEPMKQMKDALNRLWSDESKRQHLCLLLGDYHQLGVWLRPHGPVVAFDPAPTLYRGALTVQRLRKGDELRLQRIKDEMAGEDAGGGEEAGDEEVGGEGEQQPEPEPEQIPQDSCGVLMMFASPSEFIDKLTMQGGLDLKQCLAPYKLYPVSVKNELTSALKEKRGVPRKDEGEAVGEEEEEVLVEPLDEAALGTYFTRLGRTTASVRGRVAQGENYFMEQARDKQDAANCIMGIVVDHIEPYTHWKPQLLDAILKYGDRLHTLSLPRAAAPPHLAPQEITPEFHVTNFNIRLEMEEPVVGDLKAGDSGSVLSIKRGLRSFFDTYKHGVVCCKQYCVGVWRAADDSAYCLWEPHSVGPGGRWAPGGGAALVLFSTLEELAQLVKDNVEGLGRPGVNKFCITPVKVFWEFAKSPDRVTAQGAVPDEGYEWKVLTAFVEMARGRTILRGTRPPDPVKFSREAALQSSCGAVVGACMAHVRRPHLWTARTVDQVMAVAGQLFSASVAALGYEFRPGEDVLLPLQVLKRFILGVNYVRYELEAVYSGKLEQKDPSDMTVRCALERFFERHTHGVLWSVPLAVAVWRSPGAPPFYMLEPHATGPTGLRADAQDDGAACVMTFTSSKLMAYAYLQNVPVAERPKHEFQLYALAVSVQPIKKLGGVEPPLVRAPPGASLVPATSKVGVDGSKRRASESDRKHPPDADTCRHAPEPAGQGDRDVNKQKGQRNTLGWLVMPDGTQHLSAHHSIACRRFPHASRGYQALACSVMCVAMSRVEDVCRWTAATLDQVLDSGDQLYQDSFLHFKPRNKILTIEQVLRKLYTPGNCVCRVLVFQPRHKGAVPQDLHQQVSEFFREERCGVLVAGDGRLAVALLRTCRGYYMFDAADRDRYGRAVAPPCTGKARACFSQFPNVQTLVEKLGPNVPPVVKCTGDDDEKASTAGGKSKDEEEGDKGVRFEEPATFAIYGMEVTSLRRLNHHER